MRLQGNMFALAILVVVAVVAVGIASTATQADSSASMNVEEGIRGIFHLIKTLRGS